MATLPTLFFLLLIASAIGALIWFLASPRIPLGTVRLAAVVTLYGAGIALVAAAHGTLIRRTTEVAVPLKPYAPELSHGLEIQTAAQLRGGGPDTATIVIEGLSWSTRILLFSSSLVLCVTIAAVALIALRMVRALQADDVFRIAPNAIRRVAGVVAVGGILHSILRDIGAWRAGVEALFVTGAVYEGTHTGLGEGNWEAELAALGWLIPADFSITVPFWPILAALGLALIAAVFRVGSRMRKDVAGLI